MFCYIAFAWNTGDPVSTASAHDLVQRARAQSTPWRMALERDGLVVFFSNATSYPEPQILPGSRGVVLGALFSRLETQADLAASGHSHLTMREVERILASGSQELVEHCWGDYVALLFDENDLSVRVLRGPASTLPCLHTSAKGVHVYFSRTEHCAQLGVLAFSIDWLHVARTLMGPLTSPQTSIREIREILPGVCEHLKGNHVTQHVLWDPLATAKEPPLDDHDEAARTLRAVTRACVHAWVSRYPCLVHGLSGGLDSSLTLACMADAPNKPRIVCLTQYAHDTSSDERPYARLAAERAGCELIEYARSAVLDLRSARHSVRSETSPGLRIPSVDRIEADVARDVGAAAIFKGEGGDEIFCRNQLALYVADFIRERGFGRGLMGLVMHAAMTEGVTAWQILARSVWNALLPHRWSFTVQMEENVPEATLLHPDVIAQLRKSTSARPPARRTWTASPGRSWQIGLITARRPFYGPFSQTGDPASIAPLLSQPVIEVCLRIPTWLQMTGRRDRALARAAFAADLPEQIEHRRDKGGAEDLANTILVQNMDFIREMLLGGLVIQQGILDRRRLDAALSGSPSSDGVTAAPLFNLLGTEIWARAWAGG